MTRLLIVESPNKTDKIQHYLGSGWVVAASYGHIRDLPPGEMGVAPPDYRPQYVTGERSGKTIAKLKALARDADEIWLATDPDREGEAIAWHLQQVVGHGKTCRRVTFNEITQSAVAQAIRQPRQVDTRLFAAQEARRVLDRLYGYKVSSALGNKLGQHGLSAGRVQSVALRLVVEREEAIRKFQKVKHFGVLLSFASNNGTPDNGQWNARWTPPLTVRPGKDAHLSPEDNADETPLVTDRAIAEAVLAAARQGAVVTDFADRPCGHCCGSAARTPTFPTSQIPGKPKTARRKRTKRSVPLILTFTKVRNALNAVSMPCKSSSTSSSSSWSNHVYF